MTVLVDTSVWIDHFRRRDATLVALLDEGAVTSHPFVIGELALGSLRQRATILTLLRALPAAPVVADADVHGLVDAHRLDGRGVGWVDVHLLASARSSACRLWSRDRRLNAAAAHLGLAWSAA